MSTSTINNNETNSEPKNNIPEKITVNRALLIPTQIGYRPTNVIFERPPHARVTIRRDNKKIQALSLPKISNYNVRSFWSKISNFSLDMNERLCDASFLTEVWEKKENRKHQMKLEEMLEMRGIKYISTPRPGTKRGGGAAIAVKLTNFNISKLNIAIPGGLEIVWGLLRPNIVTGSISKIIMCCFYSPPRSRKKNVLIDHLTVTLQSLLKIHPCAGVVISGDRNDLEISAILSIDPSLRQTVRHSTRGEKVLDIIVTNLSRFYSEPVIVPPLHPDTPGQGAPSDHRGVVATPYNNTSHIQSTKQRINIRPLPDSLLQVFERKLKMQEFNFDDCMSIDEMINRYENITNELLNQTLPEKQVIVNPEDRPWFTEQLRKLKRMRMREYNKHGRSTKYSELSSSFNEKFHTEYLKYLNRVKLEVTDGTRGSIYPVLKKLGRRPGDTTHATFQLPSHAEQNCSAAQSAELIAEHFSRISQQFLPLDTTKLPQHVQTFLSKDDSNETPILSVNEVYARIMKAKKPRGLVPGDLPRKVVQVCAPALSIPITAVFNKVTRFSQFPMNWKIEHQIAIPKVYPPENEDDLRNIAKTPFVSKVYESFIGGWLLPIVKPYLDPGQCGIKGLSITHYLIKLLNFVHKTLDLRKPHAVLAACVDMSKAFNRVDHTLVIQDLFDMHTPAWLLKILVSYLSNRSMHLTHNGEKSSLKMLPGGGPQGAYLGGIIFIIKYNGAFLRPPIPRPVEPISEAKATTVKFIDDGTVAVSVDLQLSLIEDPEN